MENLLKEAEKKMKISLDHLRDDLGRLRTGRASLGILEGVNVEYYGTPTPLNQVATLGVPDSKTITIQPWDTSILKDIEKALLSSDLGLTPNNDGKMLRLTIPPMTQERRQQLVKVVKKNAEDCRVAIRNVRRDINDKIKSLEKKHEISEDDSRKHLDRIQKITDKHIQEVDQIAQAKEKDVLEV
ncbi:MAG: ribosome recycling factor [Nitrospinaceae bacterium]|nr:ribosome recycling factor [Nitrospinaceae bacterium]NIR56738.1 ribosome recycling factor [Nitrospinaceae bacterium]NIS87187.1 ribosome recycling factor [Nitrospinaceae bacterium]NIT84056.1 ribosome recycling factor [Nitrospinaceae bacterium]NIU46239.1 ribosome recycling factor [Nitrospinaceae bacterium]